MITNNLIKKFKSLFLKHQEYSSSKNKASFSTHLNKKIPKISKLNINTNLSIAPILFFSPTHFPF